MLNLSFLSTLGNVEILHDVLEGVPFLIAAQMLDRIGELGVDVVARACLSRLRVDSGVALVVALPLACAR